ncbi:MAG: FAD:protein FMN transferase [Pseudomonadales bacterium]|nr:FAD:protein FMN transferase [Pseudomonadales bacterium]
MGTNYTIKIIKPPEELDRDFIEKEVWATLSQIDELMSSYKANSEVSRFNQFQEHGWFTVSADTFLVMELAQKVSELSHGSFDVTVAPLIEIWGFGTEVTGDVIPTDEMIQRTLQKIGYNNLLLDPSRSAIKKNKPLTVNLSAIAKGYAVDKVAERLVSLNLNSFLIEVGGEVWAKGLKQDQQPWRIAVESPLVSHVSHNRVQKIIDVSGVGVATSGDYRNYFEKEGRRYSHTIDPTTGKPVQHNLVSVTVVDQSTARADAWATALLVMGLERGMVVAEENDLAVFFIVKEKAGFMESMTKNFEQYLTH